MTESLSYHTKCLKKLWKSTYNRPQNKRRKNEAEPALKKWTNALEDTSSSLEQLECPGSNSVIMQNQEI